MGKTLSNMIEKRGKSFVRAMKGKKFEYTTRRGLAKERNVTYEKRVYKIQAVLYFSSFKDLNKAKLKVIYDDGKKHSILLRKHLNDKPVD